MYIYEYVFAYLACACTSVRSVIEADAVIFVCVLPFCLQVSQISVQSTVRFISNCVCCCVCSFVCVCMRMCVRVRARARVRVRSRKCVGAGVDEKERVGKKWGERSSKGSDTMK